MLEVIELLGRVSVRLLQSRVECFECLNFLVFERYGGGNYGLFGFEFADLLVFEIESFLGLSVFGG